MKYSYKALKGGKTIEGTSEAANKQALITNLSNQGIHPLAIKELGENGKKAVNSALVKRKSNFKILSYLHGNYQP